ncbi:MAG: hypothetical protein ABIS07_16780 [Dokdonella sp.]
MNKATMSAMLCAFFAFGAAAAAEKPKEIVKADTREAFEAVAASVRKEMETDGRYAYVKADERTKVEASLAEMDVLFVDNGSVDKMDKATQVKLFNAQEVVNSILTLRDRDRLICERGAPTGSRIVSTNCRTYGSLEAARQDSAKFMQERTASPCNTTVCKGQ